MTEPNQTAFILKVTHPDAGLPNGRLTMFYAVISDDADTAVRMVREAVKEDAEVEMTEARLSQATAHAIGLSPGYARAL